MTCVAEPAHISMWLTLLTLSLPRVINSFSLSPEIYHTVWRIWQWIICSDESWLKNHFSLHLSIIFFSNGWKNLHYELGIERVNFWLILIKKPIILCARSTSRSWSEQSMKRRSGSENMWKVCLFYSHSNKILWLSNSWGVQRFVVFFSWLCFSGADWLCRWTSVTWIVLKSNPDYHILPA